MLKPGDSGARPAVSVVHYRLFPAACCDLAGGSGNADGVSPHPGRPKRDTLDAIGLPSRKGALVSNGWLKVFNLSWDYEVFRFRRRRKYHSRPASEIGHAIAASV